MTFVLKAFSRIADKWEAVSASQIRDGLKEDYLAWAHLDAESEETKSWLNSELGFLDPFVVPALTAEETRPRISEIGTGILLFLRAVGDAGEQEDMVGVRLYADKSRIISLQKRSNHAIDIMAEEIANGDGSQTAGEFISRLAAKLSKRADTAVAALDDLMDDTERRMVENNDPSSLRKELSEIRMSAIKLRRYLAPQREALFQLKSSAQKWLSDIDRRSLHESYNRTVRSVEELDAIRERAQIVKDEISTQLGEKLNRNTYVLSLIAAIFLPLGFLTGLFGMNVGGLPGVDQPLAFAMTCGFMLAITVIQIIIFRKLKWF